MDMWVELNAHKTKSSQNNHMNRYFKHLTSDNGFSTGFWLRLLIRETPPTFTQCEWSQTEITNRTLFYSNDPRGLTHTYLVRVELV